MHDRSLFTSESVTEGHPDKVADAISDAVLDCLLEKDPVARVACETLVTTGLAIIAGEITTSAYVHLPDVVRDTIRRIGYTDAGFGFDANTCAVMSTIDAQSRDIGQGVDTGGAGDQGMMFGFATDETEELMPMPIMLAHRLTRALADRRKSGDLKWLRPDGKSQVTVVYEDGQPVAVDTVVISTQHADGINNTKIRKAIISDVIEASIPKELRQKKIKYHINPTGRFVIGGPQGDCGLTGRKIIVDTYGGMGRHGGGAFSGKDPSKVDRSACYAARWVAKNIVAAGLARRGGARLRARGYFRHGYGTRGAYSRSRERQLRPYAKGHHHRARPSEAHLWRNVGLRTFRPHAREGRLGKDRCDPVQLGAHGQGSRTQARSARRSLAQTRIRALNLAPGFR